MDYRQLNDIITNDKSPIPLIDDLLDELNGAKVYYRIFVKNYGIISMPLAELLKKHGFHWNEEAEAAFERLKLAMNTTPVLLLPDFSKPFALETDANDFGLGAILVQEGKPLAYISKFSTISILGYPFMRSILSNFDGCAKMEALSGTWEVYY